MLKKPRDPNEPLRLACPKCAEETLRNFLMRAMRPNDGRGETRYACPRCGFSETLYVEQR